MPRKAQWPPVPRRHAGGQARVTVAGRDYYLGPFGSPEAAAALAALVARVEAGRAGPKPAAARTVADCVLRWMGEVFPAIPAGAHARNYRRALSVLVRLHGAAPAAALDCARLEAVQAAMASGSWLTDAERSRPRRLGNVPGPWNRRTVNRGVGLIRTVWRWVERRGLVPPGAWAALRALPPLGPGARGVAPVPTRRRFTGAQAVRVALALTRSPARLILLFQLWTGCRSGEARLARWDEIDAGVYTPASHKNAWRGQSRAVALGPRALAVLAAARRRRPGSPWCFPADRRSRPPGPVDAAGYGQAVRLAAARAGVPGFRPYACRHIAKQRVTAALGLDAARAYLGQKSLSSTDGYGDSLDLDTARRAAARLG